MVMTWEEDPILGFEFKEGKAVKNLAKVGSGSNKRLASCEYYYNQIVTVICNPCDNSGSPCTDCTAIGGGYTVYCTSPSSDSGTNPNTGVNYGGGGSGGNYVLSTADANAVAGYNDLLGDIDVLSDPIRPHITVTINKPCQGDALRALINNAQVAQAEYSSNMNNCLIAAGFGAAAIDVMNNGGFYKMIVAQMKNSGGKGPAGYRAAMFSLGFGALAASVCVNSAYNILQTKYIQYESDFKVQYNTCN
jgi:hypothetical protein